MSNYSYNEKSGRYRIENAEIWYPNFSGVESQFNQTGKRTFKVAINEELAGELQDQGIYVSELRRRDDTEPQRYTVKIGVYANSEMYLVSGRVQKPLTIENCGEIDREFRNGYVRNGEVDLKFHVSVNSRINPPKPYLRLDAIYLPIEKDEQAEKYADYDVVDRLP